MAITVQAIEQKDFGFEKNGYKRAEVDVFLDEICDELLAMQSKMDALQRDLAAARSTAATAPVYAQRETNSSPDAIAKVLVNAQRVADDIIAEAHAKADQITASAKAKAETMLADLDADKQDALLELSDIKAQATVTKEELRKLLTELSRKLDD